MAKNLCSNLGSISVLNFMYFFYEELFTQLLFNFCRVVKLANACQVFDDRPFHEQVLSL